MTTTTATDEQQTPDGQGEDVARLISRDLAQQGGFPRIEADIKARADLGKKTVR